MQLVVDPVCGMEFDQEAAAGCSTYRGTDYYFCHPVCKKIFDADPTRFAEVEGVEMAGAATYSWQEDESGSDLKPDCEWISLQGSTNSRGSSVG